MTGKTFEELVQADPDKFDSMDCRPGPSTYPKGSAERIIPEHMRERLASPTPRAEATMIFIENEGALFRGPSRSFPTEVWHAAERRFVPYEGETPKPAAWGTVISASECWKIIAEQQRVPPPDFGTPP